MVVPREGLWGTRANPTTRSWALLERTIAMEILEHRQLLAITPQLVGTTATFTGNTANDTLHLRAVLGVLQWSTDGIVWTADLNSATAPVESLNISATNARIQVNLGDGADRLLVQSTLQTTMNASDTFEYDGGAGVDELVGPNLVNLWRMTGPAAGNINTLLPFKNTERFVGGTANDEFVFDAGISFPNFISGREGQLLLRSDTQLTLAGTAVVTTRMFASGGDPLTALSTAASGDMILRAPTIVAANNARLLSFGNNGFLGGDITLDAMANQTVNWTLGLSAFQTLNSKALIQLGAVTILGQNIRAVASATTIKTASLSVNLASNTVDALGQPVTLTQLASFNTFAASVIATATADVLVGAGATLKATNAILLNSVASSTAFITTLGRYLGVTYASSSPTANVIVAGGTTATTIEAGGEFAMDASATNLMNVQAFVPSIGDSANISVAYGKARTRSQSWLQSGVTVNSGSARIQALSNNDFNTIAVAVGYQASGSAGFGATVTLGDYDSEATARVDGTIKAVGTVTISGRSNNARNQTRGFGTVSTKVTTSPLVQAVDNYLKSLPISALIGGSLIDPAPGLLLGLSAAVVIANSDSRAFGVVGPGVSIRGGNIVVEGTSEDTFQSSASSSAGDASLVAIGGSVLVSNVNNQADANVGKGATLDAAGNVEVLANASQRQRLDPPTITLTLGSIPVTPETFPEENKLKYGTQVVAKNVRDALGPLAPYLTSLLTGQAPQVTTYVHTGNAVQPNGALVVGGTVNLFTARNVARAWVDPEAKIGAVTPPKQVTVRANSLVQTSNVSGVSSLALSRLDPNRAAVTIGGSLQMITYDTAAEAWVDDNTIIKSSGGVVVEANSDDSLISMTRGGQNAVDVAVNGTVLIHKVKNRAIAHLEESAAITTGTLQVSSNQRAMVLAAAGVVGVDGGVSVGIAAAFNDLETVANAFIGNANTTAAIPATITAPSVSVLSGSDVDLWALSVAGGALGDAENGTGGETEIDDAGQVVPVGGGGRTFGFGLSADVGFNFIRNESRAFVRGKVKIVASRQLDVRAVSDMQLVSAAGAVANGSYSSLGGAYGHNELSELVHAFLGEAQVQSAIVHVNTQANQRVITFSAGGSSTKENASIAGSVNMNRIQVDNRAFLETGTAIAATEGLSVLANQNGLVLSVAGALALDKLVAVGAAVDLGFLNFNTLAEIAKDATVQAGTIELRSNVANEVCSMSASLSASVLIGVGAAGSAAYLQIRDAADARVGENAVLDAKGAIQITSTQASNSTVVVGAQGVGIVGVGAAVAITDIQATSTVIVSPRASLASSALVNLEAQGRNGSTVVTFVPTVAALGGGALAFSYGKASSRAEVQAAALSTIKAGTVRIVATNETRFSTQAIAAGYQLARAGVAGVGVALALSDYDTSARALANGVITSGGDVLVQAVSTNFDHQTRAFGSVVNQADSVPNLAAMQQIEDTLAGLSFSNVVSGRTLNASGNGSVDVAVAAAVAIGFSDNAAVAAIGPGAQVNSPSSVDVLARAEDGFRASATGTAGEAGKAAVGGAVSVQLRTNKADALVDNGAVVNAAKMLNVNANAVVPPPVLIPDPTIDLSDADVATGTDRVAEEYADGQATVAKIAAGLALLTPFVQGLLASSDPRVTTFAHSGGTVATGGIVSIAFSVNWLDVDNFADAHIGPNARINTVTPAGSVSVTATGSVSTIDLAGQASSALNFNGAKGGAVSFGGSFVGVNYDNRATAHVDDGVILKAADLQVLGSTNQVLLSIVQAGALAETVSVQGAVSFAEISNTTTAYIDDEAQVESATNVNVDANHASLIMNVAGGLVVGGNVGVGISGAINDIQNTTRAFIGDSNASAGPLGFVTAKGRIGVHANSQSEIWNSSFSGGAAGVTNWGSGGELEYNGLEFGFGLSGDTAIDSMSSIVEAFIKDAGAITVVSPVPLVAPSLIEVQATQKDLIVASSGAVAIASHLGIGGSFVWLPITRRTYAYTQNATLRSDMLSVKAQATDGMAIATAGASGARRLAALAGSANLLQIQDDTQAFLGNQTDAVIGGTVEVLADQRTDGVSTAGATALAQQGFLAVGAALDRPEITQNVQAYSASTATLVASGNVKILASNDGNVRSIAASTAKAAMVGEPNRTYMNNGTASPFNAVVPQNVSLDTLYTTSSALGDLDGDGDLDLVVGTLEGFNRRYLNDGTGKFGAGLAVGADLLLGILDGKIPDETQVLNSQVPDPTTSVALVDFNGDGRPDLLAGNAGLPSRLYVNYGDGRFLPGKDVTEAGRATMGVAVGDVNKDGFQDFVTANAGSTNRLYLGQAGGAFAAGVDIAADVLTSQAIALGDVNGDGWLDVVVGSAASPTRLYRNDGTGGFLPGIDLAGSGTGTTSLALGDVDGDGDLDLVVGNAASPTKMLRNNGGVFAAGVNVSGDLRVTQKVVLADMNADGRLDVLTANAGSTNRLYRGTGGGAFAAGQNIGVQDDFTRTISVGDLNGDARPDVVAGNLLPGIGIAGSLAAPQFRVNTQSFVQANGVVTTQGSLLVDSGDRLRLVALAGSSAGGVTLGVGLSLANPDIIRTNQAFLGDNSRVTALGQGAAIAYPQDPKQSFRGMLVNADTFDDILNYAAGNAEAQDAAVKASAVYTDAQTTTDAYIGAGAIVNGVNAGANDLQSVLLHASQESLLLSIAGSLGRSKLIAVGAAGDLSELDNRVSAYVGTSAQVQARNHVLGTATSNGAIMSITRGSSVADVAAIAGSVSLVVPDIQTRAYIDSNAVVNADGNILMLAESMADYATFAGTKAMDAVVGIGASHSGVFKSDLTEAYVATGARVHARALRDATSMLTGEMDANGQWLTKPLKGVGIIAVSGERISPISVSGQQSGGLGIAGSINFVVLDENTRAEVETGAIVNPVAANAGAGLGQTVYVLAVDNTVISGLAGARSESSLVGVSPGADVSNITKSTQAILGGTVEAKSDIYVQAFAHDRVISVPAALSTAFLAAIAGAGHVSTWNVTTEAFTRATANIHTPGSLLVWADGQGLLDVMAGGGNTALLASVGASVGASIYNKVTRAYIGANGNITAEGRLEPIQVPNGEFVVTFTPQVDSPMEVEVPGAIGVIRDVLAFVFDNPIRDIIDPFGTPAPDDDPSLKNQRVATPKKVPWQGLAVTATSQDDAEILAAGFGASIVGSAQGSSAVAVFANSTVAFVDSGALVNNNPALAGANQGVLVAAGSDASYLGIAGVAAAGVLATVGAGVSAVIVDNTTQAYIGSTADVRAKRLVQVQADATEDVLAIGACADAAGLAGVAAALALVSLNTKTYAFIDDNAVVVSSGNVLVSATDDTDSDVLSGGAILGLASNVGASLGVTLIEKDTQAFIDAGARVDALANSADAITVADGLSDSQGTIGKQTLIKGLVVQALSSEHVTAIVGGGSIGLGLSIAGSGVATVVDSNTVAFIGANAKINETTPTAGVDQTVYVGSLNKARVYDVSVNILGGSVGLAGGIDLGILRNDTNSYVAAGALVNAKKDVLVLANASKDIDSFVGGAGLTAGIGIQGSVALYSLGATLDNDSKDLLLGFSGADSFQNFVDGTISTLLNSGGNSITQILAQYTGFLDTDTQAASSAIGSRAPSGAVTAAVNSVAPYQGTTASVDGATINAGRDVVIRAVDVTSALADTSFTFAFGVGGGFTINIDVGRINSSGHAEAFVDTGARVRAGRDVRVLAQQSNSQEVVATVAFNNMEDTVRAYADNADIEAAQTVSVDAVSTTSAEYSSLMPGFATLRVRVAINDIDNRVEAFARNKSRLKAAAGDVLVRATETSTLLAKVVAATVPVVFGENFGLGGASAVNDIHNKVLAYVDDSIVTVPVGVVDIAATSTPTITAIAVGAAGASTVAAGGSVAINEIGNDVEAYVKTNADVQATGSVQVRATNVSTITAITGGAAGAETVAVGAAVSKNLINDRVKAWVEQSLVKSQGSTVTIAAKSTPTIEALAIGGAGAATFALGGSVTLNEIDDVVDAHVSSNATVTGALAVRIMASEDKGRIRALSGGAAGAGTAGIGAAVATNDIGTQVSGWVETSTVTSIGPRGLVIVSGSSNTSLETATIGGAGAGTFAAGGSVSLNDMHNVVDAHVSGGATVTAASSVTVQASDASTIAALAGSVAGAGVAAIGASVATNDITTAVRGRIENATVSGDGNTIDVSASTSSSISSITAGGFGAGTFAAGGSVSLNDIQNTLDAHISAGAQINDQGTVRVQANDTSKIQSLAGTVTGAGAVSIGAALATNDIQTRATAYVEASTIVAGSLEVFATTESQIKTLSAGLSGAGTVSITGAISLNKIRNTLDAHISSAATVTVQEKAQVSASNQSTIESLSGQAGGAAAAGIGGAAAYNEIGGVTRSYIESATVTASNGNVLVTAFGRPTIKTISAGGNGGIVGISGSVGINLIESRVEARIRLATVTAFGSILVQADSGDTIEAYGGSLGVGVVGLGGSVITNTFDNQTRAFVDSSTIVARGLAAGFKTRSWNATTGAEISDDLTGLGILADSRETLNTISVSVGAGIVGVSANVTVNNFNDITEAYLDNARVNSSAQPGGEVVVRAHQSTDVTTGGGAIGGGVVGVGAVVTTTLVENQTRAFITDSDGVDRTRVFAGQGTEVTAFSQEQVDTVVVGVGVGLVGVAGSVTNTTFNVSTEAFIGPAIVRSTGDLDVVARDISSMDLMAGTVGGGAVGIGASVVVNDITSTVRAYLSESETNASRQTRVLADSRESIDAGAATAGVGVVGVSGSVIVSSIATQTRAFTTALKSQLLVNQDAAFGGVLQDVVIRANDTAVIDDDAGALAGGLVGAGSSVTVSTIKNVADAQAGASSQIAAKRSIDITATSDRTIHSLAVTFGAGIVGVQGSVAVATIGSGLDAQGASEVNSIQGVVNPAISQSSGVPNVNMSDPVAARARTKTTTNRYSITDNLSTGAAMGDTSAQVLSNATLVAGDDVNVVSDANSRLDMLVPGVSVGYVGVGGSVAIGTVDSTSDARVAGGARIRAVDDVNVAAGGHVNNSRVAALAGTAGVVGLGAAVAILDSTNNANAIVLNGARIEQAADVKIAADASSKMTADGLASSIGAGAAGVAVAEATEVGTVEASLADGAIVGDANPAVPNVGNLVIKAGTDHDVSANSEAAAAGLVGVGTNVSTAEVAPTIRAYVGDVDLFLTGNLEVEASSEGNAQSDTAGLSGGLGALGVSVSNATVTPEVDGYIKAGATVNAGGNVTVRALHNYDAAGNLLRNADSSAQGAYAEADSAGGAIIDGRGSDPTATSRPDVDSYIAATAQVLAGGATSIEASASHVASAEAFALSIGIGIAVGASVPTADGDGTVRAHLDGAVSGGTDLKVATLSYGKSTATGDASGGGLLAVNVPKVETSASPTVEATIQNSATVNVTRDVLVDARSQGSARSEARGLSVGGLAVGSMQSEAEVSPTVLGYIGNTTVKAGRHVQVLAYHNATAGAPSAVNETVAISEATGGGLVAGLGATPEAKAVANVNASLGSGGTIDAVGDITFEAVSANNARSDANAISIGAVAVGASQSDATASGSTQAHVDGKIVRGANLSLKADSRDYAISAADASGGGLVAVNVPHSHATIRPTTKAFIGNGIAVADIKLTGSAEILADGTAYGSSSGIGSTGGVIGVGHMRAVTDVEPVISSYVASSSKVDAGQDLTLRSLLNYINPTTVDAGRVTAAKTSATGSLTFLADIESARSTATLLPTVLAEVKPSSTIKTGNDVSIVARAYHEVSSGATGDSFAGVAVGSTNGVAEAAGSVRGLVSDPANFVVGRNLLVETQHSGSAVADSKASAGGLIAGRESLASADAHPLVEAALNGGATALQVGGNATVRSFATFDVTAEATGDSGGAGTLGKSAATAQWRPDIQAYLDTASTLQAGGDVAIQAYNNHAASGAKDVTRRVRANAISSVGALLGATGALAQATVDSETEARVRPRASITARNIDIVARSRNQADVDGNGSAYAAAALGSVVANADFTNQTLAGMQAGTAANLTTLNASADVTLLASTDNVMDVDSVGGVGGLLAAGAAEANARLLSNRTEASVGNNSRIDASSDLEIIAENRANLAAKADQVMGGGVTDNETRARVRNISQTVADVGTGVKIKVNTILMYARDINLYAEAISSASAPFALGGTNQATSIVNSSTRALTHVGGGGTDIIACKKATFWAFADKVTTITRATTSTTGVTGNLVSVADNTKDVDADVVADAGSKITTEQLVVDSGVPVANAADYERTADTDANTVVQVVSVVVDTVCTVVGEVVTLWGLLGDAEEVCEDIVETFQEILGADVDEIKLGSQSLSNTIDFNSQVVIKPCLKFNPLISVSTNGLLQEATGALVFDGQKQLKVGDAILGGQVIVGPVRNDSLASIRFSARGGVLKGAPVIDFDAGFDSIKITNASNKDLVLSDVESFNRSLPTSALYVAAGNARDFQYRVQPTGINTNVDIASTGTGNVILRGMIANPGGSTRIIANRDILAEGDLAEINTRLLEVASTAGSVGRLAQPLPVLFPATDAAKMGDALAGSGITSARGNSGVFLKLAGRSIEDRPVNLKIDQIVSPAGPVDIQIVNSESLRVDKAFKPVTRAISSLTLVDNVSVGTQQSPQSLAIRTPQSAFRNDVQLGKNVVVTGQLAVRGDLQLDPNAVATLRVGSMNLGEGSRLNLAASSGFDQRGETSRTVIGPGPRTGQFSVLPEVGSEIGFGVFISRFGDTNSPVRYGNDGRVEVALYQAGAGDANGDRGFDSGDLVAVFTAGIYETGRRGTWTQGDWDGNGFFDTSDLIAAFTTGDYERPSAAALPAMDFTNQASTAAADQLLSTWQAASAADAADDRREADHWLSALEIAWAEVGAATQAMPSRCGCQDEEA